MTVSTYQDKKLLCRKKLSQQKYSIKNIEWPRLPKPIQASVNHLNKNTDSLAKFSTDYLCILGNALKSQEAVKLAIISINRKLNSTIHN